MEVVVPAYIKHYILFVLPVPRFHGPIACSIITSFLHADPKAFSLSPEEGPEAGYGLEY